MIHEWEAPLARAGDSEQRYREDEEYAALDHRREMAFHNADPKPAPRVKRRNAPRPDKLWRERVLERDQGCRVHANPADCSDGWQAHHVVPQQVLRRERPGILWDVSAGIGVCGLAHRQHHARTRPIALSEIPPSVVAFLRSHGFADYLDRHYGVDWLA